VRRVLASLNHPAIASIYGLEESGTTRALVMELVDGPTLANVLKTDPDWTLLPGHPPPAIGACLRRCLHKDPKQRLADMQDVRLLLEGAFEAAVPQMTARRGRLAWMIAAAALVLAGVMCIPTMRRLRETPQATLPETRVDILLPTSAGGQNFALSPDGLQIVFVASSDGPSRLWLRPLDKTTTQDAALLASHKNPLREISVCLE
jgi:hypothetical protein